MFLRLVFTRDWDFDALCETKQKQKLGIKALQNRDVSLHIDIVIKNGSCLRILTGLLDQTRLFRPLALV